MNQSRPRLAGSTDVSIRVRFLTTSTGAPVSVDHAQAGIDMWYQRGERGTKVSITEAALAAVDSAHSDGGMEPIGDGYTRLDLPDAACAAGVEEVFVGGSATGITCVGTQIPLVAFDPYADVIGSLSETAGTGDPDNAKKLMAYAKQLVNLIIGADGAATFPAAAAPANGVGLLEVVRRIHDFVTGVTAMTESYAADGAALTIPQALYMITQAQGEFSISGTTLTVKKRDGSTTAYTLTLNSATTPTSVTQS